MKYYISVILTIVALLNTFSLRAYNQFPNKKAEVQQILDTLLGGQKYEYRFIDIDNDGCQELFIKDETCNRRCVIAWNGQSFTAAELGVQRLAISYNNGVIIAYGGEGTGITREIAITIKNSTIVSEINCIKTYNIQTDTFDETTISTNGTAQQLAQARTRITNSTAREIETACEWIPFDNFSGQNDDKAYTQKVICESKSMISAFVFDHDGTYTNIRKSPKGAILYQLKDDIERNDVMLTLVAANTKGWFRIASYFAIDRHNLDMMIGGFIHYSCIAVYTRNYGGQTCGLKANIDDQQYICTFNKETLLRPIRISQDGYWVYVATIGGKYKGWIEMEKLCGNSVTNCN